MDLFFGMDTQKDTIVNSINTVMLDPTGGNQVIHIGDINSVIVNGKELGLGGYLDIGLLDTMKDLFVNFIGAVVFSIIGFFYVKKRGKGAFTRQFLPRRKTRDADFKRLARKELEQEEHEKLKDAGIIVADPLYRPICPKDAQFFELPHIAFSGRIYLKKIKQMPGFADFI